MASKKRTILIADKPGGGYYVDYFRNEKLVAEKRIADHSMRKLHRMILKSKTLPKETVETTRRLMDANYHYVVQFADNPKVLNRLKRLRAKGLDPKWEGISCPLWMATEVKDA